VPGIVISPFVQAGSVCHELFDHTSVLKLLGEEFGGGSYSQIADARPVASLSKVLDSTLLDPATSPRQAPEKP
jgi:phospholipase C